MRDDKQHRLDQIAAEIVNNNVCPDLAEQAKHLVPGEGNPDAQVMFIGEAPGKNEDLTGKPFVGAAGKFLDELLLSIGLKREDVFITSILKYRPPNNRDPKPAEKEAFWPYLLAQIETIRPRLIVALGRHGANCFLPELKIGQEHGKPQQWSVNSGWRPLGDPGRAERSEHDGGRMGRQDPPPQAFIILPLYHPAAALYNSKMRQIVFDDFKVITTLLS